ncbi:hypothetical protein I4U23_027306 [Adineta vaga]|nr:hypothetical protein I4U23_027306 [Adineta vaga]
MATNYIEVKPLIDLEKELQYEFKNKDLLRQALTHQSAIYERHPMAHTHDYSALAFLGDSALKYAVARYLILNGREEVITSSDLLHKGTQTIVPNAVLAEIAQEKLHLNEYMIRGNGRQILSVKVYASCFEAIVGAIALDCGNDHQEVVFRLVERLCSDRYETLLKPVSSVRFAGAFDGEDEDIINITHSTYRHLIWEARMNGEMEASTRTPLQNLGYGILWFLAICGAVFIIFVTILLFSTNYLSWNHIKYQQNEL